MNPVYITKIIKNGDSHGLIIPAKILRALKMERGDQVIFQVGDYDIVSFRKITDAEKLELKLPILLK